jgi:hypothetical protein
MVFKVAVSFGEAPVVTTAMVEITVAASELSYVTLGKIAATRSVLHATWSISTAHRVRSAAATACHMASAPTTQTCATAASTSATCAAPTTTSTTVGYQRQIALVSWKRRNAG